MIARPMPQQTFAFDTAPAEPKAQSASGPKVTLFEYCFGVFAALTFQGAFFPALRGAATGPNYTISESDPVARVAQAIILVVLVFIVFLRRRWMIPTLRLSRPYAFIILICTLSTLWSQSPFVTFRRSMSLMSCFLFGYYAYTIYGPRNFIRVLGVASALAAFFSLVTIVALPSIGIEQEGPTAGAAKGVFAQKNELSVNILIGICNSLYLAFIAPNRTRFDRLFAVFLPINLVVLGLSRGVTSMLALGFMIIVTSLFYFVRKPKVSFLLIYGAIAIGAILMIVLAMDPDLLFKAVGKEATLTGRWPLWVECVQAIKRRPLLGYGYAGFWDPDSVLTQYIWARIGWPAPNAHNGFIQLALDIGVIGMAFYIYLVIRLTILTVRSIRIGGIAEARWLSLFLIAMFIENIDEGTLAWPDLMASEVAFGSALTESWWRGYRLKLNQARIDKLFTLNRIGFPRSDVVARVTAST
jgi:O-antigen ligase